MRADRLLSLLFILQTRSSLTAADLARELEVSERTIYRDVEALSAAGVPVYAERGPGGGIRLVDSYRTNLTGLNANEVRALFAINIPAPLEALGLGPALRAALLKLTASLPDARRQDETRASQRIHLDWTPWPDGPEAAPEASPLLNVIQGAVWAERSLRLRVKPENIPWIEPYELELAPYGLVAKAGRWHLVGATNSGTLRVFSLSELLAASPGDDIQRQADFNLSAFWESWCAARQAARPQFPVTLCVSPQLHADLLYQFGEIARRALAASLPDERGWRTITLPYTSFESARRRILGFGGAARVIDPMALRLSIQDFAEQIIQANKRE